MYHQLIRLCSKKFHCHIVLAACSIFEYQYVFVQSCMLLLSTGLHALLEKQMTINHVTISMAGFLTPTVLFTFLCLKLVDLGIFSSDTIYSCISVLQRSCDTFGEHMRAGLFHLYIRYQTPTQCLTTVDHMFTKECQFDIYY